jgi:ribosomal protein L25 (general stress protein Ctc)
MVSHGTNSEAIARYQVQLEAIEKTLMDQDLAEWQTVTVEGKQIQVLVVKKSLDMLFVDMPDIYASPG